MTKNIKHRFAVGDYVGYRLGTLTYYGTIKELLRVGSANTPAYRISGFGDPVTQDTAMFKSKSKNKVDKETFKKSIMATTKKPVKRKKSVTAKKLCSKVIKRVGIKADGTLMKGYKWAKGGGRAIKAAPKKTPLRRPAPVLCTRKNPDGSSTSYSAGNDGSCRYGGTINNRSGLQGAKKKPAKKKPAAKKTIRKHEGINQTTGRLKTGWKYEKGGKIVKTKKK